MGLAVSTFDSRVDFMALILVTDNFWRIWLFPLTTSLCCEIELQVTLSVRPNFTDLCDIASLDTVVSKSVYSTLAWI